MKTPEHPPESLSAILRARTKEAHTAAERSGVMASLLRGQVTRARYALLLRNLHPLYDALERAIDSVADDPWIHPIRDPRLWRTASLERDLVYLAGPTWASLPITPTALGYAHRIDALRRDHPGQLVAHAYVRYLGDLNGGQIVARVVRKALGLTDAQGTAFYEFDQIDDLRSVAGAWRAALDLLPVDDANKQRLADEALLGFEMHIRMFAEIDAIAL